MKVPRLESEYSPAAVPSLSSERMTNAQVRTEIDRLPAHERVEAAQINLVTRAATDFYFAKYFAQTADSTDYEGDKTLEMAVSQISLGLCRQAVVSIATSIDLVVVRGETTGRTASLPHMLDRVTLELKSSSANVEAELELVAHIRSSVDPQRHDSLRYVQLLRNKWAGHASLDIQVDSWATALDGGISLPLLEAALVRVVNAFEDFAVLQEMSEELLQATEVPPPKGTIDAEGHKSFPMTVNWSNVGVFAQVMRESAKKQSDHLFEILVGDGTQQTK